MLIKLLTVKNLTIDFKTGAEPVHAVQDVSLSIEAGEIVGLVVKTRTGTIFTVARGGGVEQVLLAEGKAGVVTEQSQLEGFEATLSTEKWWNIITVDKTQRDVTRPRSDAEFPTPNQTHALATANALRREESTFFPQVNAKGCGIGVGQQRIVRAGINQRCDVHPTVNFSRPERCECYRPMDAAK